MAGAAGGGVFIAGGGDGDGDGMASGEGSGEEGEGAFAAEDDVVEADDGDVRERLGAGDFACIDEVEATEILVEVESAVGKGDVRE